jgi:NADH:ubiquinone oxidoreductase subunit 6 (subunit J)
MNVQSLIFYFFETLTALSAIGILFVKNVFKGVLLLLVCLLSLAGIYVLAFAEFVAVTQIMIYAGGVVVVIIFGIMLTSKISGIALKVDNANVFAGLISAFSLFALLVNFLSQFSGKTNMLQPEDSVSLTGMALMTNMLLPFELAGILLLIALIGAAIISTESKTQPE